MNKIINKLFFTEGHFLQELHLKQLGSTYSDCGPFSEYCKRIPSFRETGNLKHLYRDDLNKSCFAHDAACFNSKDFTKTTI